MWALARKVKNIFKSCVFMSCVFLLISCNLCITTSLCKPNLPIIVLHFGLTEKLELNRFFNIKFFSTGGGGGGEDFQGGRISFYTGSSKTTKLRRKIYYKIHFFSLNI